MENKIIESKNKIKKSYNSIFEEDDNSSDIKITPIRNRSHGKLIYSKITKKLKKNSPPKLALTL